MKQTNKHNHIDDCKSKSHNHSNNECDINISKNTDNEKVTVSENKHKDSSFSDPDEDEPESSQDSERSTVEVHHHHDHDHDHHHNHNEKPKNIVLKFFWYILVGLGLIVLESDEECGIGHEDHDHSAFQTKRWILALGLFIAFFAFFNLFDAFINDKLVFELLGNEWVQLTLGITVFIIMGIAFIKGSTKALMNKEIAEDTLVAIAATTAFAYSIFAIIYNGIVDPVAGETLPYLFYEGIEIWVLIYLGRFIEEWLINRVSGEMNSLESLKPKAATILRGDKEIIVDINEVLIGDTLLIKPGEVIPVDGMVTFGETTIDESSLTGESLPITKIIGSKVFGGTISSNGMIHIIVEKLIGDSFISKIIDGVKEASKTKPASQRMADKIAAFLIPAVLTIALLTLIIASVHYLPQHNGMTDNINEILFRTITVLVIACPCSFAMTTPMSVLISSTVAKRESVLFSSKSIFETIKKIDVICFDKTGTLTEGKFKVVETTLDKEILSLVVNAERNSNHPLASSIVKHFEELKSDKVITKEIVGRGLEIQNNGKSIYIGSLNFAKDKVKNFDEDADIINKRNNGSAIIYAFSEDEVYGYIELKDEVKQSTLNTLSEIRKMGIEIVMITGDNKNTANHIGSSLGISEKNIYSDVLPDRKSEIIKQLQKDGKNVAFVGDGINDSIALKQADIGIAMGAGSDAAIDSADIVLNKEDMTLIAYSIWLSRKTLFNVKRGFTIAIVYNIIAVPLAVTGVLPPAAGALSMVFNDSVAMLNAMTLSNKTKNKFDKQNRKAKK